MEVSSHEGSAGEFCCVGSIFSMNLLGLFVSKAIKLLLTEFVGQCRNILPLAFSALTSLRSVNTEKALGNMFLHWPPTQLIRVYYSTNIIQHTYKVFKFFFPSLKLEVEV